MISTSEWNLINCNLNLEIWLPLVKDGLSYHAPNVIFNKRLLNKFPDNAEILFADFKEKESQEEDEDVPDYEYLLKGIPEAHSENSREENEESESEI